MTGDIDLTDLDLFAHGFPHEVFTTLRRDAPVWWHPPTDRTPDGEGFWVLSRWADVHAASADASTFSSERGPGRAGGGTLLQDLPHGFAAGVLLNMMDDPRHARIRRLLTPAVTPKALALMEPELRARARGIVRAVAGRGHCDFLVDVAAELPLQALARLMGIPQEERHILMEWADVTLDYPDRDLGAESADVVAANQRMMEYGSEICTARRAEPGDDVLSAMAAGEIPGPDGGAGAVSDLELLMFFNLLAAAGSETTRNVIASGLAALVAHPDQMRLLREDPAVWPTAVEEILRWASSTTYNRRTATRDVEVGGETIRAGDKVTLWWASANRDEDVFVDPFVFDLTRDPNPHLTFGHGTHYCLGANLARLEVRVLFEELLARLDGFVLDAPIEWVRSNKHAGIRHMPVSFTLRGTPLPPAHEAAERYLDAVNAGDLGTMRALFTEDAVLHHPSGRYEGIDAICGFYRDVVFAFRTWMTMTGLESAELTSVARFEGHGPLGEYVQQAVDEFRVLPDGRVRELTITYP